MSATLAIQDTYPWDARNVSVRITLPEGFELVGGSLRWEGDIIRGTPVEFAATIKAVKTGDWEIAANASYPGGYDILYVSVFTDRATVSRVMPTPPTSGPAGTLKNLVTMKVDVSVSKAPALNETAEVTCTVTSAQRDAPNSRVTLVLDRGFELVSGDRVWKGDVVKGIPVQLRATVRAVRTGTWSVGGDAEFFYEEYRSFWPGGRGRLYLSVSEASGAVVPPPPEPPLPSPPPPARQQAKQSSSLQTLLLVTGTLYCWVSENALPPPDQLRGDVPVLTVWGGVRVYDGNNNWLSSATTDAEGFFQVNIWNPGPQVGFKIEFLPWTGVAHVVTLGEADYSTWSPVYYPTWEASTWPTGPHTILPSHKGAWRIHETIGSDSFDRGAWDFLRWDPGPPGFTMPEVTVVYPSNAATNSYDTGTKKVHIINENSTKGLDVVQHEYGHAVMHRAYNYEWPSGDIPQGHLMRVAYNAGCAWKEGWAEFFPLAVQDNAPNDPPSPFVWEYENGTHENLEIPTWGTANWANGDKVEGRVAGALWDIYDAAGENNYDNYDGVFSDIWAVFSSQKHNTFLEFWFASLCAGKSTDAWGSLMQSTIAYTTMTATLQGGLRPDPAGYDVPLTVKFYDKDVVLDYNNILTEPCLYDFIKDAAHDEVVITGIDGANHLISFAAKWDDEAIYTHENHIYNVTLVSPHTLINLRNNADVLTVATPLNMGTLKEGNAKEDVQINIDDFTMLGNDYLQVPGGPQWNNGRCDFDENGQVTAIDFSLIAMNYNLASPQDAGQQGLRGAGAQTYGTVTLSLQTTAGEIHVNDLFNVTVRAVAGTQMLTSIDSFVNFVPAYLEVVSVTPGLRFSNTFRNQYDNVAGMVDLCQGRDLTEGPTSGTFTVGTIRFRAKAATGGTDIVFNLQSTRQTLVAYEGNSLLGTTTNLTVEIQP